MLSVVDVSTRTTDWITRLQRDVVLELTWKWMNLPLSVNILGLT